MLLHISLHQNHEFLCILFGFYVMDRPEEVQNLKKQEGQ